MKIAKKKGNMLELKNWAIFFKTIHFCKRRIQNPVKHLRKSALPTYVIGENFVF